MTSFFAEPLRRVRKEHQEYLASEDSRRFDREVVAVLLATGVLLTVQYYALAAADKGAILEQLGFSPPVPNGACGAASLPARQHWRLLCLIYWAAGQIAVYTIVPALLIKLAFRRPLRQYGVTGHNLFRSWWAYLLMYLAILPCILCISDRASFQRTYPFYRLASGEGIWPRLAVWEIVYAGQFFALEFFFRGFLLHGLRRRFGVYSIFVMTVPYCMVHFGKPMLETLAAIAAGVALGFMSLKTRCIWPGAALHVAVAWTMDAAALWRRGQGWF